MSDKKLSRQRRARRSRMKIREQGVTRLSINRTPRHIYAQIIAEGGAKVLACASTLDKELKSKSTGNVSAAAAVGKLGGERAVTAGVKSVAFDRSGFKDHGRVRALADAARGAGLEL